MPRVFLGHKAGYSKPIIAANIRAMIKEGYPQKQAVAIAHNYARHYFRREHPRAAFPAWIYPVSGVKATRSNPINDESDAANLAARFHGREPTTEFTVQKPIIPDAMACIGKIAAIEYVAERDGSKYRFRHEFKVKARPHLTVSPDGSLVLMLGGAWRFTEDGFEDEA